MKKKVRILSISGGGIKGILPAYILAVIEDKLQKASGDPDVRLYDYFDLFAGTSVGGLLCCMYLCPGDNGRPKYSAAEVFDFVYNSMAKIFYMNSAGVTIPYPEHSSEKLREIGEEIFKDTNLGSLLAPTQITAYEPERKWMCFFNQHFAVTDRSRDFFVKDVIYATNALPVYLNPARIHSLSDGHVSENTFIDVVAETLDAPSKIMECLKDNRIVDKNGKIIKKISFGDSFFQLDLPDDLMISASHIKRLLERAKNSEFTFIDGFVFSNNPSLCAVVEAGKLNFPGRNCVKPSAIDIIMVSVGTGMEDTYQFYDPGVDAAYYTKFINMLSRNSDSLPHFQCQYLFDSMHVAHQYYYLNPRLRPDRVTGLPSLSFNNATKENISALEGVATDYVNDHTIQIDEIIEHVRQ
jgi:patatin-like phospholipase/acyl hydrolase